MIAGRSDEVSMTSAQAAGGSHSLAALARMYGLLAGGFQYPDQGVFARLESGSYVKEIEEAAGRLPANARLWAAARSLGEAAALTLERLPQIELEAAYNRIFVLAPIRQQAALSLHGTFYTAAHEYMQSHQLAQLSSLYRSLGLQCSNGMRPDHLAAELEFLRALTTRDALARKAGQQEVTDYCRAMAAEFIRGHLGVWVPALCRSLAHRQPPLYPALARLTREFLACHLAWLGREVRDDR